MPHRDPEERREASRRWREANREKHREASRRWREANPDRVREAGRRWREANRDRVLQSQQDRYERGGRLRYAHGMTVEDWHAMWTAQHGRCYLCGEPLPADRRRAVVDHDHACCPSDRSCPRCRRGLAHIGCNSLIGQAGDDPARLRLMARNLAKAQRRLALGPADPAPQPALFALAGLMPPAPPRPARNGTRRQAPADDVQLALFGLPETRAG